MTGSGIADRIDALRRHLPEGVTLVAVSKFHPAEAIAEAYAAGQRDFGESRAAELTAKAAALPADIRWHFIGHLQTNKVRSVVACATMIQSVDSERLLRLIDSEARRAGRTVGVLLQLHVAREETKTGFTPAELTALLQSGICRELTAVKILGVMGMATNTTDTTVIDADFRAIADAGRQVAGAIPGATAISMGMSGDYLRAVALGSTMVRIGSSIFGERDHRQG